MFIHGVVPLIMIFGRDLVVITPSYHRGVPGLSVVPVNDIITEIFMVFLYEIAGMVP
jgi:hypothetical protein